MKNIQTKIHRFFVKENFGNSNEVSITDHSVVHQMKNVLRLSKGDPVILLDGSGSEFHGKVRIITKRESIISKEKIKKILRKNKIELHLFVSLIKKDNFEWVIQKATEIGASRITPIVSERTEKLNLNMSRGDKIILESSEQSGRTDTPFLDEPISLKEALSICETEPLILDLNGENINVTQLRENNKIEVFIGPEGGWGEKDFQQFETKKCLRVKIGENTLRAETAAVAISALLLLG